MHKVLSSVIGIMVLVLITYDTWRVAFSRDDSGKPPKDEILAEWFQLDPSPELTGLRHVDKITLTYVNAAGSFTEGSAFAVNPEMVGWTFESKRHYGHGNVARHCKGRLKLSIDSSRETGKTHAGIYWTSDKESGFYCP